jgi:hypothetical protein
MTMLIMLKMTSEQNPLFNKNLNVFGYKSFVAVADELNEFLTQFHTQVAPKIVDVMNDATFITYYEAFELNGTGYANKSVVVQGTRAGNYEPDFVTWGFRYQRKFQGDRSGAKRFGWVADADVSNGIATGSIVAKLATLATALNAPIMEGIVETWFPVILERPKNPSDPWASHDVSAVLYTGVTTQNTRKR